jgi:hypothetical protein
MSFPRVLGITAPPLPLIVLFDHHSLHALFCPMFFNANALAFLISLGRPLDLEPNAGLRRFTAHRDAAAPADN